MGKLADGDWSMTQTPIRLAGTAKDQVLALANKDDMIKVITVAFATKANFWLMNYHTGNQVISAAHNLDHFTSTLYVVKLAGIPDIRAATSVVQSESASITLSADAKLRFSSMPAGTHRLAIAFKAAKRLVRSVYGVYP